MRLREAPGEGIGKLCHSSLEVVGSFLCAIRLVEVRLPSCALLGDGPGSCRFMYGCKSVQERRCL